jgi:hypothetical protein
MSQESEEGICFYLEDRALRKCLADIFSNWPACRAVGLREFEDREVNLFQDDTPFKILYLVPKPREKKPDRKRKNLIRLGIEQGQAYAWKGKTRVLSQ